MPSLRTNTGHEITLPPGRVHVGESVTNELPVAKGHGLAPIHFTLQPFPDGHFIEDSSGGLGTLVNGRLTTWAPLKHGDIIIAGDLKLTYISSKTSPIPTYQTAPVTIEMDPSTQPVPRSATGAVQISRLPSPSPSHIPQLPEPPPTWLPSEALVPPTPPMAPLDDAYSATPVKKGCFGLLLAAAGLTALTLLGKSLLG